MKTTVVLGAPGSGRKSLITALSGRAPALKLEFYSGEMPRCEAALLVVSAVDGPMPESKAHLEAAHRRGVPRVVVAINKIDEIGDEELLELVAMECLELAGVCGYAEDAVTVVNVSAATGDGLTDLAAALGEDAPASPPEGQIKCSRCPYAQPVEFDTCPSCGSSQKRSFWSRLFG